MHVCARMGERERELVGIGEERGRTANFSVFPSDVIYLSGFCQVGGECPLPWVVTLSSPEAPPLEMSEMVRNQSTSSRQLLAPPPWFASFALTEPWSGKMI